MALCSSSSVLLQHCEWTGKPVDTMTCITPSPAICEPALPHLH